MKIMPMGKIKKTFMIIGIGIAVSGFCFLSGIMWSNRSTVPVITTDLLEQRLLEVSELATVKYHYTNMGKFEESTDFYGWKVPFTSKGFILSYDGEIKAGIDMSKLTYDVAGDEIRITIPPSVVLSHVIDEKSIEVFDETKNIFNPISITDYTQFSIDQKEKTESKAKEKGLLVEATAKAKDVITKMLYLSEDVAAKYKIVFIEK